MARAKLTSNPVDQELHRDCARLIERALEQVRKHYQGDWCLARPFVQERPRTAKKRKLDDDSVFSDRDLASGTEQPRSTTSSDLPEHILKHLARPGKAIDHIYRMRLSRHQALSEDSNGASADFHYVANHGATHALSLIHI